MHERCVCPTCGRPHNKRKVIDYSARAKAAAEKRWEKLAAVGRSAVTPQPTNMRSQETEGPAVNHDKIEKTVAATKAIQKGPPRGMCPHGRESKFCTIGECAVERGE